MCCEREIAGGGVAVLRVLRHAAGDDGIETRRHAGARHARAGRWLEQV
jgi:hypothetical protein